MTTADAVDLYLNQLQSLGRHPKTTKRYAQVLQPLAAAINEPSIAGFLQWLSEREDVLSHNGLVYNTRVIRGFAKTLFRRTKDPLWRDIADEMVGARIHDTDIHVPTEDHVEALIRYTMLGSEAWRDATVVLLLADLGLRAGEVTALTWPNIDFGQGLIHVGEKHGERRVLPLRLSSRLQETLLRRRENYVSQVKMAERRGRDAPNPHYVAGSVFYRRPQYTMVLKVLHGCAKGAGVPYIRAHLLRYHFFNKLCDAHVDLLTIKDAMGHQNIATTMGYYERGGKNAERMLRTLNAALPDKGGLPWTLPSGVSSGSSEGGG